MRSMLAAVAAFATVAVGCDAGQDTAPEPGSTPIETVTATASGTVTATETTTVTAGAEGGERPQLGGDDFGVAWVVDVEQRDGEWCMTARAEGESQEICGDAVALNELHGGRETISAVEFTVGSLDITAGLVAEPVARVRIHTAAPPEDPGGGAVEIVTPIDVLVGLNAYAEPDLDPTPQEADLPTVRVVALDATGDEIGEIEPTAAG